MSFDSFASVVEELLRQYPVLRQPRYQNVFQFCSKLDESVYRNHLSFLRASRESLAAPWLPASTVDGSNVDAVLTLAWLAFFSYADESELREHFAAVGFPELRVWRGLTSCADSVQCVIAQNSRSVVVSFASTQPLHYSDFLASSRVDLITRFDTVGINIGRQRKSYFDSVLHIVDVWQPLQDILRTLDGRRLYFTGHGLGGALATVLAAMLLETPAHRDGLAHCGHLLTALVTFGSPKVGDASFSAAFTSAFGGRALRVANRFEMAIHNPPWPMLSWAPNYEHVGSLAYFDGDSAHPRSFDANGAPTALTLVDRFPFLLADFLPTEIIRRLSRLQAFHALQMPSPVVTLTPEEYVTRLRELAGDYSSSASASVGVSVSSPGSPYAAKAPASPQLTSPSGRFLGSGLHRFHSPVPSPARATSGNDVLGASALGSGSPLRGSGSQLAPSSPSGNDLNRSTSSALSRSQVAAMELASSAAREAANAASAAARAANAASRAATDAMVAAERAERADRMLRVAMDE